ASFGDRLDQFAQIVEIAGQSIHAVNHNGITLAGEREHGIKLGPVDILA
ncbi:hypothetical protein MBENS4_4439, partial [Novosphingobium sp. MBES04]